MNKDIPNISDSIDNLEIEIPSDEVETVETPTPDTPTPETSESKAPTVSEESGIRHSKAQNIVKNNVIAAMASGLIPVPLLDVIGTTNIQFHMITVLTEHYDVPAENINKSLIASVVMGTVPVVSVMGLCSLFKGMPGIGTLAGSGGVSVISGAITYALGQVFIRHFEHNGTLEDFNPDSARAYFDEEFKNGKNLVGELVSELKDPKDE